MISLIVSRWFPAELWFFKIIFDVMHMAGTAGVTGLIRHSSSIIWCFSIRWVSGPSMRQKLSPSPWVSTIKEDINLDFIKLVLEDYSTSAIIGHPSHTAAHGKLQTEEIHDMLHEISICASTH